MLKTPLERLEAILEVANPLKLAAAGTREKKRQAIAAFDDAIDLVLRSLLLWLELAGDTAEAELLRRRFQRPHRFRHPSASTDSAHMRVRRAPKWLRSLWARLRR